MMRPQVWEIEKQEDGTHTVTRGHRPVATGLSSQVWAEKVVSNGRKKGERVWLVESDGYRTDLTKTFHDPVEKGTRTGVRVALGTRPAWSRYLARYGRGRP